MKNNYIQPLQRKKLCQYKFFNLYSFNLNPLKKLKRIDLKEKKEKRN